MATFDPYRKWLGIPVEEQPPNHYRLLGIGLFESDHDVISNAADRQMAHVRTFQSGSYSELSQRLLNELAAARVCLLDDKNRATYDRQLRDQLAGTPTTAPPAQSATSEADSTPISTVGAAGTSFPSTGASAFPDVGMGGEELAFPVHPTSRRKARPKVPWLGIAVLLGITAFMFALLMYVFRTSPPVQRPPARDLVAQPEIIAPQTSADDRPANAKKAKSDRPITAEAHDSSRDAKDTLIKPSGPSVEELFGASGQPGQVRALSGHQGTVTDTDFLSTGKLAVSGGRDGTLRVWDLLEETELSRKDSSSESVLALAVAADGSRLLASGAEGDPPRQGLINIWKTRNGTRTNRIDLSGPGAAWSVEFSPDGRRLLLACEDGTVRLLSLKTAQEIQQCVGHEGAVRSAVFSPDGTQILSGGTDQTVRLWNAKTGAEIQRFAGHTDTVTCVAFAADGKHAVSGSADRTVRVWDLQSGRLRHTYQGHSETITQLASVPDSGLVVSASLDGTARVWKLPQGGELYRFEKHRKGVRSVACSAGGRFAISGGDDGVLRLWRLPRAGDGKPEPSTTTEAKSPTDRKSPTDAQQETTPTDEQLGETRSTKTDRTEKRNALIRTMETLETRVDAIDELPSDQQESLLKEIFQTIDEAIAQNRLGAASRLIILGRSAVAESRNQPPMVSRRIASRAKQVQQLKKKRSAFRTAMKKLESQDNDPAANQTAGRYLCLLKGDWQQGLPRLAAGGDGSLEQLAQDDLTQPATTAKRLVLADRWWQTAQQHQGPTKQQLQRRAAHWYELVLSDLSVTDSERATQRIAIAEEKAVEPDRDPPPSTSGYECRSMSVRKALLEYYGGNAQSEAAVQRACKWLADHQFLDGHWSFNHETPQFKGRARDKGSLQAPNAATALSLLPLLGTGNGLKEGKYRRNVSTGIKFLRARMVLYGPGPSATLFENVQNVPSHALGTIALCEASAGTRDRQLSNAAQGAVNFIVLTQNADGGWGFRPRQPKREPDKSDVFHTCWNIFALQAARWAGLQVPPRTLHSATTYFHSVRTADGTGYISRTDMSRDTVDPYSTAAAMLANTYLGWSREQSELVGYVTELGYVGPFAKGRPLMNFHNSQILRDYGGHVWNGFNAELRDRLLAEQETGGVEAGSWIFFGPGEIQGGGRLYSTALAALMLEVYYRNPPLYQSKK